MTGNKSLLLCARLAARLEDFMSLHGLPSALFGIYTCVVLRLFFILSALCAVKNKFTLPLPQLNFIVHRDITSYNSTAFDNTLMVSSRLNG